MYIPVEPAPGKLSIHGGGTRLAILECEGEIDLYAGWSPRNRSHCAEGTWADWVELAKKILKVDEERRTSGMKHLEY